MFDYSIIGAGNGGQSVAAFLSLKGKKTILYDNDEKLIANLERAGGIKLKGAKGEGFANNIRFTNHLSECVQSSKTILICTPAFAHYDIAIDLSDKLKDGQYILLCPGSTGGALEFTHALNTKATVIVGELESFFYACRAGEGVAEIYGVKKELGIAAIPSTNTQKLMDQIAEDFPELKPRENVLEVDLNNINPIVHVLPIILNVSWVESKKHEFLFYKEGISPTVAKLIEKMDLERLNITEAIGVGAKSVIEWQELFYGVRENNLYETIMHNTAYNSIKAPNTLSSRLVIEDVPMGLVPMEALANLFNVHTPNITDVIDLSSKLMGVDFRRTGRTLERLGLAEIEQSELLDFVKGGI